MAEREISGAPAAPASAPEAGAPPIAASGALADGSLAGAPGPAGALTDSFAQASSVQSSVTATKKKTLQNAQPLYLRYATPVVHPPPPTPTRPRVKPLPNLISQRSVMTSAHERLASSHTIASSRVVDWLDRHADSSNRLGALGHAGWTAALGMHPEVLEGLSAENEDDDRVLDPTALLLRSASRLSLLSRPASASTLTSSSARLHQNEFPGGRAWKRPHVRLFYAPTREGRDVRVPMSAVGFKAPLAWQGGRQGGNWQGPTVGHARKI